MNLCAILFLQQCFQMNFDPSNSQFANLTLFPSETRHNVVDLTRFFLAFHEMKIMNTIQTSDSYESYLGPRLEGKLNCPKKFPFGQILRVTVFERIYLPCKKMRDFQKNKTITWRLHFHPFHSTNVHFYVILWPHCSTLKSAEWLATF